MADFTPSDPRIGVTSNEPVERKHLVQPYSSAPTVDPRAGGHSCAFCGNRGLRRSRMRFTDLPRLLLLQLPVRCTRCGKRQHATAHIALSSVSAKPVDQTPTQGGGDSWKAWTQQEYTLAQPPNGANSGNPMSHEDPVLPPVSEERRIDERRAADRRTAQRGSN